MSIIVKAHGKSGKSQTLTILETRRTRLGRAPQEGVAVSWDMEISREHADLWIADGKLCIECVSSAKNPIYFEAGPRRKGVIKPGESFLIGTTTFLVVDSRESSEEDWSSDGFETEDGKPKDLHAFSSKKLRGAKFANTEQQIEILSQLPKLIASSENDKDLAVKLVHVLLEAIPQAQATAVVQFDPERLAQSASDPDVEFPKPELMRVETRDDFMGRFVPSRRLMTRAILQSESAMHVRSDATGSMFTMTGGLGWAFCAPIPGESCHGWCLYVTGEGVRAGSDMMIEEELTGDLRFTELVAQFIGSVRQVRVLEVQKTKLSSFFSPHVVDNLTKERDLEPSEQNITVLFCDVRGFSRKSEQLQGQLPLLLKTVSSALGVMANSILDHGGAIADFQGDAALGFWGWPMALDEGALPACRAALKIVETFESENRKPDSLLKGFSVGLGIAHGKALAGQIGPPAQAKIGVFGPVVNQGARLEGMTKKFGVSICLDESALKSVGDRLPELNATSRRLASVYPKGMDTPVPVYTIAPQQQTKENEQQVRERYVSGLDSVVAGDFQSARQQLEPLAGTDSPSAFLLSFLESHQFEPPGDWDGVIPLASK